MEFSEIKKITIIGSGSMGTQVAIQCALFGYETAVYARSGKSKKKAEDQINKYFDIINSTKKFKEEKQSAAKGRLQASLNFEDIVSNADIIIESSVELVEVKKEIFKKISSVCRPNAIVVTNTSTFIPSMFLDSMKYPERFAALHFHSYVWSSTIVDVMPHQGTSENTMTVLQKFAGKIGQIPIIMKKESHNYVFNSIMTEINKAALTLVVNDISTIKDIDLAWRGILKMSVGPFGLMDMIGIDTIYHVNKYWAEKNNDEQLKKNSKFLENYISEGKLGMKAGEGFYQY
jgi:3-hydroxybutyryl-CoA dehydrogenase